LILSGPVNQIEKLPVISMYLSQYGISIDEKVLLSCWMLIRPIKGVFLEVIYTFGCAYMIYCWYYHDWKMGFNILIHGIICGISIIILYCCIEVPSLAHNELATSILTIINPYMHAIKVNGTWWPPLLWTSLQLRAVFAEPSYYGMFSAFSMPFLWYLLIKGKFKKIKILYWGIFFLFVFGLYLTKARTAVALFTGEVLLLLIFTMYLRNKKLLISVIAILLCTSFSFLSANYFINNFEIGNVYITNEKKTSVETSDNSINRYYSDNLSSLTKKDQRSNHARFSMIETCFKIGADYPVLGVGNSLRHAYIPDYFSDEAKQDLEVQMWIKNQKKQGILKTGFPSLSEYATRFAENGLLGLILFLLPSIILLKKCFKNIKNERKHLNNHCEFVFLVISLIGILASGLGDSLNIMYCYWIILGIGFAMCEGEKENINC
jgi:hypothetical protein